MANNYDCRDTLMKAGISYDDAHDLRRIAMTLHRWHELECGDSNDFASWCISRGRKNKAGEFEHDDDGEPYIERHAYHENKARYSRIPDRERGAQKRLAKIMARYPGFSAYVQTDPRGASLYILRPSDISAGEDINSLYTRGIAVYK